MVPGNTSFFRNRKNYVILLLFVLAALAILRHQRHSKRVNESNYELFTGYVDSYTTGIISRQSPITIHLASDVQTFHARNEQINEELFHFSPEIKGKAYWKDARTVEFRPEQALEPDREYSASFKLSTIMEVPDKVGKFNFDFQTIKPDFAIEVEGLRSASASSSEKMKLKGTITTADVEESALVEKMVQVSYDKDISIAWEHNQESKLHTFTINNLKRYRSEKLLSINYNGEAIQVEGKGSEEVAVPAYNDFKVLSVKTIQDKEQYISVLFSDPIRIGQELTGLLGLSDMAMPAYTINGNEVKLYPADKLDGNYTVFVNEGIENFQGKKLPRAFTGNIVVENLEPSVTIPGKGVILPHSGKLMMPFEAVNLKAVDVTIIKIYGNNIPQYLQNNDFNGESLLRQVAKPVKQTTIHLDEDKSINLHKKTRFMLDIDKLVRTEPGAIYRIMIGYRPEYSIYSCKAGSDQSSGEESDDEEYGEDEEYSANGQGIDEDDEFWSRYDNYYPYGYNWDERNNPCNKSYYNKERWASRNVLASNIGLIAKQGTNNRISIAVTDILSAEPMANVELELMDYQHQVIGKATSGDDGLVDIQLKRKPYLLVAKKGEERAYLKLDDGSSLPLSRFNIGGEQVQKGLKGFLYGERGVWRPGDSLYLTFILDDKENKLPPSYPVELELYTPQGQLYKKQSQNKSLNGFYSFKTSTEPSSPTGNWTAKVKAGGALFEKRLRIETIMPNRLKINLSFGQKTSLTKGQDVQGNLKAEWLFGGAGRNLNAKIDAFVSAAPTLFNGFDGFVFDDPVRTFSSQIQPVFEGKLDENGLAQVKADINIEEQAPGRLNANFLVKVFEPGGNFSINQLTMPYNVYSGYVGLKMPEGSGFNGMLSTDKDHLVEIVNVNTEGRPLSGSQEVEVELYKMKWAWWWDEDESSVSNFTQDEYNKLISTSTVTLNNGKGSWNLRINQPDWGRFLVRVRDPRTGHTSGKIVYIDWPNWAERMQSENPTEASMLSFTSDKSKYRAGEQVTLTIPSGNAGRGLVSIENGSRVIRRFWFEAKKGQTQVRFRADASMTPNVFVNITLLQPHSQTINDLPIRMYGVIPIEVEDPETILKPLIKMPEEIRPESNASLTVSEASGKAMTYTIAIVDEGLLDITNFPTPDPHASFYAREGLGVKTWDLFDYVIGAYGGELQRILSIGGDRQSGKGGKNPTANRFKPVVKFLGPFKSDGSSKTHSFKLPQYVGSVRVMVIAGQNGAYGFAEKAVKVKKPLMVLATLPRVLSPGEQFKLPVTVFSMSNSIKQVSIEVQSNAFNFITGNKRTVDFQKQGDQLLYLDLATKNVAGIAKIKVLARSGKETASYDVELDVRNPNPVITRVIEKTLEPGSSLSIPFAPYGTAGTNKATIEVSSIAPMNLDKRLSYLIQYPHGCAEQVTSAAFPQLHLSKLLKLSDKKKAQTEYNIKAAIGRLNGYQTSDGGIAYWPGLQDPDEWCTNYAGHFLLEAEANGYTLPSGFMAQWKKFQKNKAVSWTPSTLNFYGGDLLQAYRLYLLALSKSAELGAMNRLKEFKYLSIPAKWQLAAAYRLAGQTEVAVQLTRGLPMSVKPYRQSIGTFGSDIRDQAMILETLVLLGRNKEAYSLAKGLAFRLSQQEWYSTQSTAYALIALARYCGATAAGSKLQFAYSLNGTKGSVNESSYVWSQPSAVNAANKALFTNKGKSRLFIRIIQQGKPAVGQEHFAENNDDVLSMRVNYFTMGGQLLDPATLPQGTDFMAQVNITNPGKLGRYDNLALTQLFPSGWEIINTRLLNSEESIQATNYDYKDVRDDRVNTYFSLQERKEATFFVLLNASYIGKFYLPATYCEAMYNSSISAAHPGQWVQVTNNQ
ncbi:alpha-2-macroglobulin family protein [Desertivirga arenae]|uniref:alpha-2-macroglobulin family protein n=1 Tax=Desertivirga arenae TaxID=2810309 RepID=UPI001A971CB8|nr:MG2 domain-containing protein [Pedobacter sp. SYSU D00823]